MYPCPGVWFTFTSNFYSTGHNTVEQIPKQVRFHRRVQLQYQLPIRCCLGQYAGKTEMHSWCRINLHFRLFVKKQSDLTLSASLSRVKRGKCACPDIWFKCSHIQLHWLSCHLLLTLQKGSFATLLTSFIFSINSSFGLMIHCDYLMARMLFSFRLAGPCISNTVHSSGY